MKISSRQKRALEKITGKPWDRYHPDAVEAYFAFTDRGIRTPLFNRVWRTQLPDNEFDDIEQNLWDLIEHHVTHPWTIEYWKEDFLYDFEHGIPPLLFLWDFYDWNEWDLKRKLVSSYPDAYVKHAFEIYREVRGYIPIDDVSGCKEWAEKLGVECGEM